MLANTRTIKTRIKGRNGAAPLYFALCAIVGIQFGLVKPSSAQGVRIPFDANQTILDRTNAYRTQKGLPRLGAKGPANVAANKYAEFLAQKNLSGHKADGTTLEQRLEAARGRQPKPCRWAENVYTRTASSPEDANTVAEKAVQAWINSPDHEVNLRSQANGIGIGIFGWKHGNSYVYKAVQVFTNTAC